MAHPALEAFVTRLDQLVTAESHPTAIATGTAGLLPELLAVPEFLENRDREPSGDSYTQHIVHVHPEGLYSIVSLVWLPGQSTPIHDHRCWCVVGVLQGREQETRFHLYTTRSAGEQFLVDRGSSVYQAGEVCWLVPPEEDIHVVENKSTETGISIHVYGADISKVGTSINHTFNQPIQAHVPEGAERLPWREFDRPLDTRRSHL